MHFCIALIGVGFVIAGLILSFTLSPILGILAIFLGTFLGVGALVASCA